jgi:hypothetical protein
LCNAIADTRDAQRAFLPRLLVDVRPPSRVGLKSPCLEVFHQRGQILFEVGLEHADALAIDPGGPAVLAN